MSLHLPGGTRLMQTFINGGLIPRGPWDDEVVYAIGDSVDYNGSSYVLYADAPAGTLPTNIAYWQVVAEKGEQGIQGIQGETGATGQDGHGVEDDTLNFYVGDPVNGSWRLTVAAGKFEIQVYNGATWVKKAGWSQ